MLRIDTAVEGTRLQLRVEDCALFFALPGSIEIEGADLADRANWMVFPARSRIAMRISSPSARAIVIELARPAIERTLREYVREDMERAVMERVLSERRTLPRTTWVDELAHRYVFERGACEKHESAAASFLETELLKEAYYLTVERALSREREPLSAQYSDCVARAIAFLEKELARDVPVAELARRAGVSTRTLERAFRRELGQPPARYARALRLDQARALLRAGHLRVSQVATRIGYDSLPAFSSAYRARFGHPPSEDLG
jgi:AraC-like DNA-binding protein